MSKNRLVGSGGHYVQVPSSKSNLQLADGGEWVKYRGPRGGEGWENTVTGERVYQKEKPGTSGAGQDERAGGKQAQPDTKTNTPYDVTDQDVPDPKWNPNNYDEFGELHEMMGGDMHGVNAGNMYIAEGMRHKIFIKNLRRDLMNLPEGGPVSPDAIVFQRENEANNAFVASKLMHVMNETAPEHYLHEGEYLAVEAYDGRPLSGIDTREELFRVQDSMWEYAKHMAANAVIGNLDPHGKNVFLGWEGYATVDLDQAFSVRSAGVVVDGVARKFNNQMEELFGYEPTDEELDLIRKTAKNVENMMEVKARDISNWLRRGKEREGISPDDLSKRQRKRLQTYIDYIDSGKHKGAVTEALS